MIQLSENAREKVINTNWIFRVVKDPKNIKTKSGVKKTYISYFTSFPQELYDFFDIKDDKLYLIKVIEDDVSDYDVIISDRPPALPITYRTVKLINRRKRGSKSKTPSTFFNLSKKLFINVVNSNKVMITLHPATINQHRNKLGLVTLKLL